MIDTIINRIAWIPSAFGVEPFSFLRAFVHVVVKYGCFKTLSVLLLNLSCSLKHLDFRQQLGECSHFLFEQEI